MTDEIRPPCRGMSWLFDSTDRDDHQQAKAICAACPLIGWCEEQYRAARRDAAAGGEPEGTWAGKLRGVPERSYQTHCVRNHERTPENLYSGGKCRPCALARSAEKVAERQRARGVA